MDLQRQVAAAPVPGAGQPAAGVREAQQAAAQQVEQAGQIQLQATQRAQERTGQIAQLGEQARAQAAGADIAGRKIDLVREQRENESTLEKLGRDAKQELFDARIQFAKDESGRQLMNEGQLADWAVSNAKSTEELRDRTQTANLLHQRRMDMLQIGYEKVSTALRFEQAKTEQTRNHRRIQELAEAEQNLRLELQREQNDAKNKQAMWQTGGTIAGTVAGGVLGSAGGPAGTVAGASIGGAVGGAVGGVVGSQTQ
jgi:hypothetical protein